MLIFRGATSIALARGEHDNERNNDNKNQHDYERNNDNNKSKNDYERNNDKDKDQHDYEKSDHNRNKGSFSCPSASVGGLGMSLRMLLHDNFRLCIHRASDMY